MTKTNEPEGAETPEAAETEAVTTREEPKGVKAGVEFLRTTYDESAHVLWKTGGPRNSHIEEIAGVLVEIDGSRRIVIVNGMASGAYKLFTEVPMVDGAMIAGMYQLD